VSLVLDASLALSWIYPRESTVATELVLDQVSGAGAWVPEIWRIEVANALQQGLRRGRIDLDDRDAGLADLSRLAIQIDPETNLHAWTATVALSTRHRLTVYDACYLELALRRGLPLATLDTELRTAAKTEGVALLGL
jgi:predicted nucleic acid-binding protein